MDAMTSSGDDCCLRYCSSQSQWGRRTALKMAGPANYANLGEKHTKNTQLLVVIYSGSDNGGPVWAE